MRSASMRRGPHVLILLFLLVACGDTPKATLTGQIRDAYTNEPVEGALVTVGEHVGVATDEQGRYATQAWSAKDTMTVEASGYDAGAIQLTDQPGLTAPNTLTVTLDAELRPNTLTGVIRDEYTEEPLAGAVVMASEEVTATTDAEGRYTLYGVPEEYQISVVAPDHEETRADIRRATEQDVALRPTTLEGMVTDASTNSPLEGVDVTLGDAEATTDGEGRFTLRDIPPDGQIVFSREGYEEVRLPLDRTTTIDQVMRPALLEGTVLDAASGTALSNTTVIASESYTGTAIASVRTDENGRFRFDDLPEGAYLKALRPGYRRGEAQVSGDFEGEIKLEPFTAKAIYLKANVAANPDNVPPYLDIIDQTEANALVLDLKSDNLEDVGLIYYQSNVPLIRELGTSAPNMDLPAILAEAKRRNIYTIARIHIFAHDNALLEVKPEWYVQNTDTGEPWFADFGIAWLDTYNEEVWDYNIQLAVEAAQLGFDEIQFDYIRFPSDGDLSNARHSGPRDWQNDPQPMYETIGRFMERAHKAINDAGAYFSVDVFGYVAWEPQPNIGQNLQVMGRYADYVCPMVYPSHFLYDELGLGNPSLHPYEIVAHSMQQVKDQMQGEAARAGVRPWLQDFTLIWVPEDMIVEYGPAEVRAQIDAAEDNGAAGWALWDSDNDYTVDALEGPE